MHSCSLIIAHLSHRKGQPEQDVAFEIGAEFSATRAIYLSEQKYEFTDGWIKFMDYRGTAESYDVPFPVSRTDLN